MSLTDADTVAGTGTVTVTHSDADADAVEAIAELIAASGRTDLLAFFRARISQTTTTTQQQTQPKQQTHTATQTSAHHYTEAARLQASRTIKATSLWDLYPAEVRSCILSHASLLTRFLLGCFGPAAGLDNDTKLAVWQEALDDDWAGDLGLLPNAALGFDDMLRVTSRAMYHRLCERFALVSQPFLVDVPLRRMWIDAVPLLPHAELGITAVVGNHAAFLKHLLDIGLITIAELQRHEAVKMFEDSVLHLASAKGSIDVLQMLSRMRSGAGVRCTSRAMDHAAGNGHLNIVQWLHANRSEGCSTKAMDWAAANGHIGIVQWLSTHRSEGCTTAAMDAAATNGHFGIVQWLHEHRAEGCTTEAMDHAASSGNLDMVIWLSTHRAEGCTVEAMSCAARNGHLHVVQWLHEHRTEGCTTWAMDKAAAQGYLEVVKWLSTHRTEGCTEQAIDWAACDGHLDVVIWLSRNRTEGCTTYAIDKAAANGHLAVVQWLLAHRSEGFTLYAIEDALTDDIARVLVHGVSPFRRQFMLDDARADGLSTAVRRLMTL